MYNNPYMQNVPMFNQNYGQQSLTERIDGQIQQLNQMKEQIAKGNQQPAINQTFQIASTNNNAMRYVNTIEDVQKETVYFDTPFFSKDMSVLWLKGAKGDIKTYELNEIVPKDPKDMQIELLQNQINELKKEMKANEQLITDDDKSKVSTDTEWNDETTGEPVKKSKSTSIQRVSTSKKEQ